MYVGSVDQPVQQSKLMPSWLMLFAVMLMAESTSRHQWAAKVVAGFVLLSELDVAMRLVAEWVDVSAMRKTIDLCPGLAVR